jgi:hypothetical protein
MANYRGLKFENSIEDFTRWSYSFPPLERGICWTPYQKVIDGIHYYCSFEIVKMIGTSFVGVTVRKFEKDDFEWVDGEAFFKDELLAYKRKYNI